MRVRKTQEITSPENGSQSPVNEGSTQIIDVDRAGNATIRQDEVRNSKLHVPGTDQEKE